MIRITIAFILTFLAFWSCQEGQAATPRCDIALTLALDYSNSVSPDELKDEAKGHAAAILSDEFVHAFTGGGAWMQVVVFAQGIRNIPVPWVRVTSKADLENISGAILATQRPPTGIGTNIPMALEGIVGTFEDGPQGCTRQVIDIATDGDPDTGASHASQLLAVQDSLDPDAVQINVLFVGTDEKMLEWAREHLVYGFGAFFKRINDWHEIEPGLRAKLLREVS